MFPARLGQVTRARPDVLVLVLLCAGVVVQHLWWVGRFRADLAVDRDEAMLLGRAFDASEAASGGLFDLAAWWTEPSTSAPGLAAVTGLTIRVFGSDPVDLMLPVIAAVVLLLVASWAIGDSLGLGAWSALPPFVVACAPGITMFARVHHQIIPAAALFTACVAVALRCRGFGSRPWSMVLGALVGLAVVSRSMLLFVAPIAVIAPMLMVPSKTDARERLGNAALSVAIAVAIALTWWIPNGSDTLRYLADGGRPESSLSILDPNTWLSEATRTVRQVAGVPAYDLVWLMSGLCLVAIGVAGVRLILVLSRSSSRGFPRPVLVVGVSAGWAVFWLALERDDFLGYPTLVLPLLVVLGTYVLRRHGGVVAHLGIVAMVIVACAGFMLAMSPQHSFYQFALTVHGEAPEPASGSAWSSAYERGLQSLVELSGSESEVDVALTGLHDEFTASQVIYVGRRSDVVVHAVDLAVESPEALESPAALASWLRRPERPRTFAFSSSDGASGLVGGVGRGITQSQFVAELRRAGLSSARAMLLPDGRRLTFWKSVSTP